VLSALFAQHGEYVFAWKFMVEAVVVTDVPPDSLNEFVLA
jgi:hypothetical protein